MIKHEVFFFDKPGPANTQDVIRAVRARLEGGNIHYVVVASISGSTALKMAEALKDLGVNVVCVSLPPWCKEINPSGPMSVYPSVKDDIRAKLKELNVTIVDRVVSPFDVGDCSLVSIADANVVIPIKVIAETLRMVGGQGFKTAVEVAMMATDAGYLPPYSEVISVGGTDRGADTSIVVQNTFSQFILGKDKNKRFEVREIIAMPRKKIWYW